MLVVDNLLQLSVDGQVEVPVLSSHLLARVWVHDRSQWRWGERGWPIAGCTLLLPQRLDISGHEYPARYPHHLDIVQNGTGGGTLCLVCCCAGKQCRRHLAQQQRLARNQHRRAS